MYSKRKHFVSLWEKKRASKMNVLIVNTSERTGGAAVAAGRLLETLNNSGEKAKMLVRDKQTDSITVAEVPGRMFSRWHFLWERWCIFCHLHFSKDHLFEIDIANSGTDITSLPEFKWADVIHLNWINQGMLSLGNIRKILKSGKPVVWTMHDMWPATGICHYSDGCLAYKSGCANCPLLPDSGSQHDLSNKVWRRKKSLYADGNICFVACSRWLESQARQSALLKGQRIQCIPNAIDHRVFFCRHDKEGCRREVGLPEDKKVILFVSHRVTDQRKGMSYFIEAVDRLVAEHPEMKTTTVVAVLGGESEEITGRLALKTCALGYVTDEKRIATIYNAADIYVLPSIEDNLPNTIMEAMACGVPCVGFRTGGIPEMIDHRQNGYVADFRKSDDLAAGMHWLLCEADYEAMSRAAVSKVHARYSQQSVAMKYIEVYNEMAAMKKYII